MNRVLFNVKMIDESDELCKLSYPLEPCFMSKLSVQSEMNDKFPNVSFRQLIYLRMFQYAPT